MVSVFGPDGAPKGGGNKALPWSGLRNAKPMRREGSDEGGDRVPNDLVLVKSRGREGGGAEYAVLLACLFFISFLSFFFI